jgi:hypothetical protein
VTKALLDDRAALVADDDDERPRRPLLVRLVLGLAMLLALAAVAAMTFVTFQNSSDVAAENEAAAASSAALSPTPSPSPSVSDAASAQSTPSVTPPAQMTPSIIPLSAKPAGAAPAAAYPPVTMADLQAFAATGYDTDVGKFGYEMTGNARCFDPLVRGTVDPALKDKALAASAVAYFLSHGLATQPCKATLVLYYSHSVDLGEAFTAARVSLGVNSTKQRFVKVEIGDSTNPTVLFSVNIGALAAQ